MLSPSGQDQGSDVVQVEVGFLLFPHEGSFFTDANARAELRRAMSPARLGVKIVVENQRANNSFRKCGCRQVRMYDPSMIGISHGPIFSPINCVYSNDVRAECVWA